VQDPLENAERKSMIDNVADRRIPPGSVLQAEGETGNFGLNGKLFLRIIFWWVITVPAAFGGAYVIELIAK
jgi:phosphate/sulfate permease